MDGEHFDAWARRLARASSRRALLQGAAAAFAGLVGHHHAAGAACPPEQVARGNVGCVCETTGRPPANGLCPCPSGQTRCNNGPCTNLQRDPANCGACGNVCPAAANATTSCSGGQCRLICNAGFKLCDGACIPVDGCCTVADCPAPTNPCQAAATCVGNVCGYEPAPAGTVCRPVAGDCDLEETCDGTSTDCPPDSFADSSVICRSAQDVCELPATCTGTGPNCPDNPFAEAGTPCRPAEGECDVAEYCTGSSSACPADEVLPAGTVCRASSGVCDEAESCDGVNKACPTDSKRPNNSPCGTNQICCDGVCVSNASSANCGTCGTVCGAGQACSGGTCVEAPPCPLSDGGSIMCGAGETCAITSYSPIDPDSASTGCCPADGVLCDLGSAFLYDLCCPAGDTCEVQTTGSLSFVRCSSSGEICPSTSGSGYQTCQPGETCAVTNLDLTNPASIQTVCCPVDGVLCASNNLFPVDLCCPAGDTCESQQLGSLIIPRCSSSGEVCPSTSGSGYLTCQPGETCAVTNFDITNPSSAETVCCPADGVLCDLGNSFPIDLCCPAGDTCEVQDIGGSLIIPRCSSSGEVCFSFSSGSTFTCQPGETCAITRYDPSNLDSFETGCCPADGVLCDIEGGFPFDLCCPAGDTCKSITYGYLTLPGCSSDGEVCPSLSGGPSVTCQPGETCAITNFDFTNPSSIKTGCCPADGVLCDMGVLDSTFGFDLCCPAGDTCEVQDIGGALIPHCSSVGEVCPALSGGSIVTCQAGETCEIVNFDPTNPGSLATGCCPADATRCPMPGGIIPLDLCCPAGVACETVTIDSVTYPKCGS